MCSWRRRSGTDLEDLVGSLLPLLGHGVRSRLGSETDGTEDGNAGSDTGDDTPEDAAVGAGGVLGTGAVGTEGDPVSCQLNARVSQDYTSRGIICNRRVLVPAGSCGMWRGASSREVCCGGGSRTWPEIKHWPMMSQLLP
jgi:hypothetical protein